MKAHDSNSVGAPAPGRFPPVAGLLVMGMGLAGLAGWIFDIAFVRELLPGFPTMKANTALCFLLSGVALWLSSAGRVTPARRAVAIASAVTVALIGLLTLGEYLLGVPLRIDEWLFRDPSTPAAAYPGRMAVPTALNFALFGIALLALQLARPRPAIVLAIAAMLPSYVVLAGYIYAAHPLHTSMAIHTAMTFLLLSAAIVATRPDLKPMSLLGGASATGLLARRLLLAALALPLALGWLRLTGQRARLYGTETGLALFAVSHVAVLVALILWNARSLLASDALRRAAEERERRTAEKLRLAAEAGNVGLWDWDVPTNEVYFSSRWKAQLGYADDEIPHRFSEWENRLHPDDRERALSILHRYLAKPWPDFEYDFRLRHKDGSYRWILARADTLLGTDGQILHMTGCHIDVTEQKRAEAELKRTLAELERSNAELAQFAYIASHDLQEPLRAVTGCVQLLAKRYRGRLDERAEELIQHSVDGAARMQALIQDLLAYSRVGSHATPMTETDCGKALDLALANLSTVIGERGAVITRDPLPTLRVDRSQVVQLFQNLIGNGVKFCAGRQPEIHVRAEARDGEYVFSVRDNGIGIEPKYHERIFEIFQRLHTRSEYPGTGIGLALCKRIVERHGGRIWLESAEGQGTTFYFSIPQVRPEHA